MVRLPAIGDAQPKNYKVQQNQLYMKLPKIAQTQSILKRSYFESIVNKPTKKYKVDKLQIDWQSAEIDLITKLPDTKKVLDALIQLQAVCKNNNVPHFYSYYFVNKLIAEEFSKNSEIYKQDAENLNKQQEKISKFQQNAIAKINMQVENLKMKKSKWSKITQLISFRQNIVSKINDAVAKNKLELVHASLDDIRHINAEIIRSVISWQQDNAIQSDFAPIFMYEGRNYLIKMVSDNAIVIDILNVGTFKFLSPPNPFYLSKDGNKSSMSQTQQTEINDCMELLAKQKANELKMLLNPPKYVFLSKQHANDANLTKSQTDLQKAERIRNIYKSSNNLGITISGLKKFPVFSAQKQKQQHFQLQKSSVKKKQKSQKIENDKKNRKSTDRIINSSQSNPIMIKIQNLKKSVQQNRPSTKNIKLDAITTEVQKMQIEKAQNLLKVATYYSSQNPSIKNTSSIKMKLIKQKQLKKSKEKQIIQTKQEKIKQLLYQKRLATSRNKTNSLLINEGKNSQKLDTQRSGPEPKQKTIFRIKKQPIVQNTEQQQTEMKQSLQNSQLQLRMRLRQLRNQSIMQIYGKKRVSTPKIDKQSTNNIKNKKQQQKNQQKQMLEIQLKQVQRRIQQLNSKNKVSGNKNQKMGVKKKEQKNLVQLEQEIKNENKKKQKQIEEQQNQRQKLLLNLNKKEQKIKQLFEMLNKQEVGQTGQGSQNEVNLQSLKNKKLKQIENLKQSLKNQNKLIKQQMEQQQKKFMKLKEAEYQMIEQQLNKKHQQEKQLMKQQFKKLNRQLEQKILEQERKRRENELKLMQQKRQLQQLRIQMEEKTLREKLLQEILKQQAERNSINQQEQKKIEAERAERLKKQILQREAAQRKVLQRIQQDNRKLKEMFEQMKRRNEEIEVNNVKKMREIDIVEQEVKKEVENQNELYKQLNMATSRVQEQVNQKATLNQQNQNAEKSEQDIQQLKLRVKQQILKAMLLKKQEEQAQKLKDEEQKAKKLLEIQNQIRNELRRQQEQMQRIQKQQRSRYERIKKELEQQHRRKMEELEKQDAKQAMHQVQLLPQAEGAKKQLIKNQQKQKYLKLLNNQQQNQLKPETQIQNQKSIEKMKEEQNKEIQKQKIRKEVENQIKNYQTKFSTKQKMQQQQPKQQKKLKDDQKIAQKSKSLQSIKQSLQQKVMIETVEKNKSSETQNKKQNIVEEKNKQEENKNIDQNENKNQMGLQKSPQIKNKNQMGLQKSPQIKNKELVIKADEQLIRNSQINKSQTASKVDNKVDKKVENEEKPVEKQQKKQSQMLQQSSEDMLSKYQNLQQYLSKCKQVYIDDRAVPQFVNTFMSQFSIQIKQMLPYSSQDLEKFMLSNRKVDIFKSQTAHSIGWLEADKYILVGQITCVESIAKKYGQTQIEMTYVFNKSNPYQKQFLAKQVKIFDKIGFIFQKKLKQESMYSIKFVIKIPSQIVGKNFKPPTNQLHMNSKIVIGDSQQLDLKEDKKQKNNKYSYSYLLSQTLKNCLSNQQLWKFKDDSSEDGKLLQQKMEHKLYNDPNFKTVEFSDKRIQFEMKLQLKYIQTHDFPCFVVKGAEFNNPNSYQAQKFYIAQITQNLSLGVIHYEPNSSVLSLDLILNVKTKRLAKERQILICLPVWKKNQNLLQEGPGPKKFTYSHAVEANLAYGSIVSTTALKENFKFIQPPFIFALFQTNNAGLIIRTLSGEVVEEKDIIQQKR